MHLYLRTDAKPRNFLNNPSLPAITFAGYAYDTSLEHTAYIMHELF